MRNAVNIAMALKRYRRADDDSPEQDAAVKEFEQLDASSDYAEAIQLGWLSEDGEIVG